MHATWSYFNFKMGSLFCSTEMIGKQYHLHFRIATGMSKYYNDLEKTYACKIGAVNS